MQMKTVLIVPESMAESVAAFVESESIPLGVCTANDTSAERIIRVVPTEERLQSDGSTLYAGGWITCAAARAMGAELGFGLMKTGKLLDFLDVKIRRCELGCFK